MDQGPLSLYYKNKKNKIECKNTDEPDSDSAGSWTKVAFFCYSHPWSRRDPAVMTAQAAEHRLRAWVPFGPWRRTCFSRKWFRDKNLSQIFSITSQRAFLSILKCGEGGRHEEIWMHGSRSEGEQSQWCSPPRDSGSQQGSCVTFTFAFTLAIPNPLWASRHRDHVEEKA